ncbi:hypothetical protein CU097_009613 [Rhizopus azygosporus]|uniref:Uncharacterized protein n=1 Tax=Rhizopus azygosporus TaxID=86630 RepID=A0A367JS66_RHIAZ|nr:hypothetical protein CU097_009613 [Rhizopus azygosporus]
MATVYLVSRSDSYSCPQRVPLTEDKVQPVVRRLSQQSERRQSEERRKSIASLEKAAVAEQFSFIQQGKLPTNRQIHSIISRFLNSDVIKEQPISEDGQYVLKDIQGLLDVLQRALDSKNPDELLQSMIFHAKRASELQDTEPSGVKLLTTLKVIRHCLFDSRFRSLLSTILLVAQNILSKNAASRSDGKGKGVADRVLPEDIVEDLRGSDPDLLRNNDVNEGDLISHLKNIFDIVKENPEYKSSLEALLTLVVIWTVRLSSQPIKQLRNQNSAGKAFDYTNPNLNIPDWELAALEAKRILERWSRDIRLDPFIKDLNNLACIVKTDEKLYDLYIKARILIHETLDDEFNKSSWLSFIQEIQDSGVVNSYQKMMTNLIYEAQSNIQAFKEDPLSKEISQKLQSIYQRLWYTKWNGMATLKPHLLDDFKMTLLPALIEQIKYVPLPPFTIRESKENTMVISNMILSGDTLMPETIELKLDDNLRFHPKSKVGSTSVQGLLLQLYDIETIMEDVKFQYKRKVGFFDITDLGVATVHIHGLKLSVKVTSDSMDKLHRFQIQHCFCHINKLDIRIKESKHGNFYKVFNPVLTNVVKRQITKEIEKKVIGLFHKGDEKLTKHLGGRRNSKNKDKRRGSFFSQVAQVVNHKFVNGLK